MTKTTFVGHPLHTILHPAPSALLPFSLVMDILYQWTDDESYAWAAYYTLVGGCIGGWAAALTGMGDLAAIATGQPGKRDAWLHAALDLAGLALASINLLYRRRRQPPAGTTALLCSSAGTVLLLAADWYGGQLVYKYGI